MIERLTGTLAAVGAEGVVVDVGGVGFLLEVSAITYRDLPAVGAPVVLLTHLQVREDALQLYGFSSDEERELFRLFIGVSKIGPRLAIAALSSRRPVALRHIGHPVAQRDDRGCGRLLVGARDRQEDRRAAYIGTEGQGRGLDRAHRGERRSRRGRRRRRAAFAGPSGARGTGLRVRRGG